jgi:hypothetical protein
VNSGELQTASRRRLAQKCLAGICRNTIFLILVLVLENQRKSEDENDDEDELKHGVSGQTLKRAGGLRLRLPRVLPSVHLAVGQRA